MFFKSCFSCKKVINFPYKVILFIVFLLFLPGTFRFLDNSFQKYFGLNKFINVFDFILWGSFIFCFIKKDKIKNYLSISSICCICFFLLARVSIYFSQGQIHHRAYYDLFKLFFSVILFFIFFTSYFQKNYQKIIKIFLVIFFTISLFESIIGIMQFVLQKPIGFSLIKEPLFGVNIDGSATIFISENKQLFFNKFSNFQGNYFVRAHGTFFHPNIFSGFLNISCILTLYLIYKSKKKLLFSCYFFVQLIALIFTFSRAGLVSLVISCFLFFLFMFIKKYNVNKIFFIFLSILFVFVCFFSKYLIERGFIKNSLQSTKAKEINYGSNNMRILLKNTTINMIKKHPFFGVGFRNFLIKKDLYSNKPTQRAYVHNIYLLISAEMGLISLLMVFSFMLIIIVNTIKYCLTPLTIAIICLIVSFLLIGFFDHYPISSYMGKIVLFSSFGFLNFLIEINKPSSYFQKVYFYQ